MSRKITGKLGNYFETGCEGVYWCLQEDGKTGWDGLIILTPKEPKLQKRKFKILYNDHEIWKGKIKWIHTWDARLHPYFKQYVKKHGGGSQLNFGGLWVHYLPTNIDLGLWYSACIANEGKYSGEIY